MSMLEEYVRDLAELVNRDCGTTNCAGVTSAAEVMKRHFESIGWEAELVDLGPTAGRGLICRNKPGPNATSSSTPISTRSSPTAQPPRAPSRSRARLLTVRAAPTARAACSPSSTPAETPVPKTSSV